MPELTKTTPTPYLKRIRLDFLSLRNFKGCTGFDFQPDGYSVSVYGNNAAGKTTLYDALCWLLFGKDSSGASKFNIKPLDEEGNVRDHNAETEVSALLDVDGQTVTLSRTFKELWTKKRGRKEAVFDGHTTEFFFNGLPVQKNDFERRVGELCGEDTFRTLTDLRWFCAGESEKKRREALFGLIGGVDEADVLASREEFAPLSDALGGLSVEEYRTAAQKQRRTLQTKAKNIPARMDEQQRTIDEYAGTDFDSFRAQLETLTARQQEAQSELDALSAENGAAALLAQKKGLLMQLEALDAKNSAHRAAQQPTGEQNRLASDVRRILEENDRLVREADADENTRQRLETVLEDCREDWKEANRSLQELQIEEFNGDKCPTCGQILPSDQRDAARAAWLEHRENVSQTWEKQKAKAAARAEATKKQLSALDQKADDRRDCFAVLHRKQAELEEQLKAAKSSVVEDMPGYEQESARLQQEMDQLTARIREAETGSAEAQRSARLKVSELRNQARRLESMLACEGLLERARERVEELREELRTVGEETERLDALLDLCDEFTRAKAEYIDNSVNRLFRRVRWQLFEEQINGGLRDCCKATVDGVPYADLNNGAKINAGLDVIRTLSAANRVTVPLFVDNAESVTQLEDVDTQVIRLVVSEADKELRVEVEG